MFNAAILARQVLRHYPHNILFASDEVLKQVASRPNSDEIRIMCIAELFSRWFIRRDGKLAQLIDQLLPDGERENLGRLLDRDFFQAPSQDVLIKPLWEPKPGNEFSKKCLPVIRTKLVDLCCNTDGFIPVFCNDKAFFIPFHFVNGESTITDIDGEAIENWIDPYRQTLGNNCQYTCVVHCHQNQKNFPKLEGHSLMLPLLLAYWRKQEKIKYNHLRLLATGSFENNALAAVETAAKSAMINYCFPEAYLLFPESSRYCADKPWEIPLSNGMTQQQILNKIPEIIESKGLFIPTLNDALRRLDKLECEREEIYNKWEIFYNQVELYKKNIQRRVHPEKYMLCLMLQSASLCHLGKTEDALELNREAQDFAQKYDLQKQLVRMQIEELVALQDQEKFSDVIKLAESLTEIVNELKDHNLLMRYYGTMGQAHCYGCLAGIPQFRKETAISYFEKAVYYASLTDSLGDIAQDLNYCYLWYALFEPETEDAKKAFGEAKEHIIRNLHGNDSVQAKNKYFLYRFKALAMYRYLLSQGNIVTENFADYLLPDDALFWLKATTNKYIAALYAHKGNTIRAKELFNKAIELLENQSGIIKFIQMTIYAEAYRSLGIKDYQTAGKKLALQLLDEYATPQAVVPWLEYFEQKNNTEPFVNFWY